VPPASSVTDRRHSLPAGSLPALSFSISPAASIAVVRASGSPVAQDHNGWHLDAVLNVEEVARHGAPALCATWFRRNRRACRCRAELHGLPKTAVYLYRTGRTDSGKAQDGRSASRGQRPEQTAAGEPVCESAKGLFGGRRPLALRLCGPVPSNPERGFFFGEER
jgi:hypothetical protein